VHISMRNGKVPLQSSTAAVHYAVRAHAWGLWT
jgi:hypothetical protein